MRRLHPLQVLRMLARTYTRTCGQARVSARTRTHIKHLTRVRELTFSIRSHVGVVRLNAAGKLRTFICGFVNASVSLYDGAYLRRCLCVDTVPS